MGFVRTAAVIIYEAAGTCYNGRKDASRVEIFAAAGTYISRARLENPCHKYAEGGRGMYLHVCSDLRNKRNFLLSR